MTPCSDCGRHHFGLTCSGEPDDDAAPRHVCRDCGDEVAVDVTVCAACHHDRVLVLVMVAVRRASRTVVMRRQTVRAPSSPPSSQRPPAADVLGLYALVCVVGGLSIALGGGS